MSNVTPFNKGPLKIDKMTVAGAVIDIPIMRKQIELARAAGKNYITLRFDLPEDPPSLPKSNHEA